MCGVCHTFAVETNMQEKSPVCDICERTENFFRRPMKARVGVNRTKTTKIHRSRAQKPILVVFCREQILWWRVDLLSMAHDGMWGICWCRGFHRSVLWKYDSSFIFLASALKMAGKTLTMVTRGSTWAEADGILISVKCRETFDVLFSQWKTPKNEKQLCGRQLKDYERHLGNSISIPYKNT